MFLCLPREDLLNSIITNMYKRLVNSSRNGESEVAKVVNLIEPSSWDIEDITVPWPDAEQKLTDISKIF